MELLEDLFFFKGESGEADRYKTYLLFLDMVQIGSENQLNTLESLNGGAPHVAVNCQAVADLDSNNAFEGSTNISC